MEFFFLSILQLKAFSAAEYVSINGNFSSSDKIYNPIPSYTTLEVLLDALNPVDTINDLIYVVGFIFVHMIMRRPEPVQPPHKVRRLSMVRSSNSLPMKRVGTESDLVPMISSIDLGETSTSGSMTGEYSEKNGNSTRIS